MGPDLLSTEKHSRKTQGITNLEEYIANEVQGQSSKILISSCAALRLSGAAVNTLQGQAYSCASP
jgi:hypothetical protein